MIKHKDHFHGSDLEAIEKVYGIKKEDITSFSANVNPLGVSFKLRECLASHIDAITSYPDREYTSLRNCIANYVGSEKDNIIVGNGSTELISLMIHSKAPKKALILGPTYSEYEREVSLGGGSSLYYPLREEDNFKLNIEQFCSKLTPDIDLLIICNPNNPTSGSIYRNDMRKILDHCKTNDIFVMVDETYIEFAPEMESISSVPLTNDYNNIIILRGISKFFAAPGLRLGYAICGNSDLLKEINNKKNPWTINTLAAIAGEIMFTDTDYIKATKELINKERERVCARLSKINGIKFYPSTANFLLCRIMKPTITSNIVFEAAIRKGLMIRDCSTFPFLDDHYIRFCFMSPEKNDELLQVIEDILQ